MLPRSFQPCVPIRVKTPPSGALWVHEIKYDGFRIVAQRDKHGIRLQTKHGADYTDRFDLVVTALSKLHVRSLCLDGEVMCFTGAQHDFNKLWSRRYDHEARLCAFDLLELDGADFRSRTLSERKQALLKVIRRAEGIEYVEHVTGDGPVVFEHACSLEYEGIVSKRIDLPYRSGRSKTWQKTKNPAHPAIQRVKVPAEQARKS